MSEAIADEGTDTRRRAEAIIARSLVWDNHSCMPLRSDDERILPELERFPSAGVDVVSLNVGFDAMPWENTILVLAHFRNWIACREDRYLLIETVDDIRAARESGRLAVSFDIEGGCALNDNIDMVRLYHDLGERWMLMAYNRNNSLGGGCQDEDTGLTDFGRRVVDEMARVAEHIDYVVQKVGPEHAGIGLDYVFDQQELKDYLAANPAIFPPEEGYDGGISMVAPEGIVEIVQALIERGYEEEHIRMILGDNLLRVARAVWC